MERCRNIFITGADAILEILTWHNVDELLEMCEFVAATRPGFYDNDMNKNLRKSSLNIIRKYIVLKFLP